MRFDIPSSKENTVAHTYKLIELVGSSDKSIEDAIASALDKAGQSVRGIEWFEVVETRGHVIESKIAHFQVTLKVGFRLDE